MPSNLTKKASYGGVVFKEKIKVLTDKLNLPTKTYTDIWEQQHAKAFVIAGAMQDGLLTDFKSAVLKSVDGSNTLEDFRKDFDKIVSKHGWDYNGGRNWRTRVIYETNTRMAYSAGRYKQMQAVTRSRPYWQYRHSFAVANPRPQHQAWDGMVLRHDYSWWNTHFPANGYGCDCSVRTLSQRDMDRKGLKLSKSPKVVWTEKVVGVTTNPRVVKVTDGIDPGFAYNPGKAVWGEQLAKVTYDKEIAKLKNQSQWQSMNTKNWQDYGLAKELKFKAFTGANVDTSGDMAVVLTDLMGSSEKVFKVAGSAVLINAAFIASHLPESRAEYLPLLIEALNDPHEVWQTFEYHKVNKKVAVKRRIISLYTINGNAINIVLNVKSGVLIGWTIVPLKSKRINKLRTGELIFSK